MTFEVTGSTSHHDNEQHKLLLKNIGDAEDINRFIATELSPRERQVLNYLTEGKMSKQMFGDMDIHSGTLTTYKTNLKRKLAANGFRLVLCITKV